MDDVIMAMRFEFEWDNTKAAINFNKHNVSLDEAATVFEDQLAASWPDESGSDEERWITIGFSRELRLLLVVHAAVELTHDQTYIRIISARKPTKHERRRYEQG